MNAWLRRFLVVLAIVTNGARAADPDSTPQGVLHWQCWYDQRVHIACVLDKLPENRVDAARPPLSLALPPIVRTLRTDPGALQGRLILIPLHAEPEDMGFTATLARAVMCGSRYDCTVEFSASPPAERLFALLDLDAASPTDTAAAGDPSDANE